MKMILMSSDKKTPLEIEVKSFSKQGDFLIVTLDDGIVQEPKQGSLFTLSIKKSTGEPLSPELTVTFVSYEYRTRENSRVISYDQNDFRFQIARGQA